METQLQKNNNSVESNDSKDENTKVLMSYSAPLPPPAMFEQYNKVVPNAAERILVMAEKQSNHRHMIEKTVVIGETIKTWFGLIFAFLIVIFGMGLGTYLVLFDKQVTGFISMITPLAIIAGAFIYKENISRKKDD